MHLKDIMSTTVESILPEETLETAQAVMTRRGIHHLVVIDRRQVVGMLTAGTLQTRLAEGVANVGDAMSRLDVNPLPG